MTKSDALRHPNWKMGAKITVDCATLMNKGLEIIEAMRLYDLPLSKVEAVIHRQSVVHSLVEFVDGAVLAQLGVPDMRIPIGLAMTYPNRAHNPAPALDLLTCGPLTFDAIDETAFPVLRACKAGGAAWRHGLHSPERGQRRGCRPVFAGQDAAFTTFARRGRGRAAAVPVVQEPSLADIFEADRLARIRTRAAVFEIKVMFMYILFAILIFGFLIFIHELGHFLTAKAAGRAGQRIFHLHGPGNLSKSRRARRSMPCAASPSAATAPWRARTSESDNPRAFTSRRPGGSGSIILAAGSFMNFLAGLARAWHDLCPASRVSQRRNPTRASSVDGCPLEFAGQLQVGRRASIPSADERVYIVRATSRTLLGRCEGRHGGHSIWSSSADGELIRLDACRNAAGRAPRRSTASSSQIRLARSAVQEKTARNGTLGNTWNSCARLCRGIVRLEPRRPGVRALRRA